MAKRQGEFSTKTKRERLKHAQGKCEAEGPIYGLEANRRCNADLARGVEFDHWDLAYNSQDGSFENCRAVCPACHRFKTAKHDVPRAAKTKRQSDKDKRIVKPKKTIKSAGFEKKPRREVKALPPKQLFKAAE